MTGVQTCALPISIVSDFIHLKVECGECLCEEKKMDMREMNRNDGSPCSVVMLQLELVPHCLPTRANERVFEGYTLGFFGGSA